MIVQSEKTWQRGYRTIWKINAEHAAGKIDKGEAG